MKMFKMAMMALLPCLAFGCGSGSSDVKGDSAGSSDGGDDDDDDDGDDGGADGDDGGTSDGGAAGGDPTACESGTFWTGGDRESTLMHPGLACVSCHASRRGPPLSVGGTVYTNADEPDDCNGRSAIRVELVDSAGETFTFSTNSAGNFFKESRTGSPRWPATARVTSGGAVREMVGEVTSGDCNSCHTVDGASGAPGRIMAP